MTMTLSRENKNLAKNSLCKVSKIHERSFYGDGEALNLLTRKITTTSAIAININPGPPTSSAKPVFGKAVEVGKIVCVELAIWVKAAPRVAVAGLDVAVSVAVACAMTGVLVGGTVFVTAAVCVRAWASAVCVNPAWIVSLLLRNLRRAVNSVLLVELFLRRKDSLQYREVPAKQAHQGYQLRAEMFDYLIPLAGWHHRNPCYRQNLTFCTLLEIVFLIRTASCFKLDFQFICGKILWLGRIIPQLPNLLKAQAALHRFQA